MNKPVHYVSLGVQGVARVFPEGCLGSMPELEILWHPTTAPAARVAIVGGDRVLALAHGILAAMGVAPEAEPGQAPDPRAKELLAAQERIASLEGALDLAGKQMEEAQAEVRRMIAAAEKAKRKPDEDAGWPQGVSRAEYKTWKEAQQAAGVKEGLTPREYKRQRDAAAEPAAPVEEPPPVVIIPEAEVTTAPEPEAPHLTEAGLAETQAIIDAADIHPILGHQRPPAAPIPTRFLELPEAKMEQGERVTLLVKRDDGTWGTPQAILDRVFPGSSQHQVRLVGAAVPFVIDEDRIKASPFDDLSEDAEPAGPDTPAPTFIAPPAEDTERFLTVDERKAFIAQTVKMGMRPERVQSLMDEHLGFTDTGRLTPEKRDALMPHLENAAKVLF